MGRTTLPLAALILIDDGSGDESGVERALLPVAGQALIETQARTAHAWGARHIVVLVDRLPPALVTIFDRLRESGLTIDLARNARDAADRVHPDERVFVIARGAIAPVAQLGQGEATAIFTVSDSADAAHLDRIDARERWTGLAVIDGGVLRATADKLGDWSLGSTLLRAALQAGVKTRMLAQSFMVQNKQDARAATLALMPTQRTGGVIERRVIAPLGDMALAGLAGRLLPFMSIAALPLILLILSALSSAFGMVATALCVVLVAGIALHVGEHFAAGASRTSRVLAWGRRLRPIALFAALFAAAVAGMDGGQSWGVIVLAGWAAVAMTVTPEGGRNRPWMADVESATLIMLAALALGRPVVGLAVVVAHAVVTQFVGVRSPR